MLNKIGFPSDHLTITYLDALKACSKIL